MRGIYIILLSIALAQSTAGQNLSDVLGKYFEVSGGVSVIENLNTIHKKYIYFSLYPKSDTSVMDMQAMLPHFSHLKSWTSKGSIKYEVYSNSEGHFMYSHTPFPHESKRTLIVRQTIDPALQILKLYESKKLRLVKLDTILKKETWLVQTKGLDPELSFYFDKQNGYLVAQKDDNITTNITAYHDFRKTDIGLVTAFKSEVLYNYRPIAREIISSVEFGLSLFKSDFVYKPGVTKSLRNTESPFNKIEYVNSKLGDKTLSEVMQSFNGKTILIDLWATWCGPCKMEALKYDDVLYSFLFDNKVEMLFITIDKKQNETNWKRDLDWFNMNGYHLLADKVLFESIKNEIYGNQPFLIPRYILVNEKGDILSKNLARPSDPKFKSELKALLE